MPSILSFACSLAVPMYGCDTAKIPKFCRMQRKSGKDFCLFPLLRSWQDKEKFPFLRSWQDNAKLRALNKAGKILLFLSYHL